MCAAELVGALEACKVFALLIVFAASLISAGRFSWRVDPEHGRLVSSGSIL
jgi:hypothetical protein